MWKFKIIETELWYKVFRIDEKWKIIQWLQNDSYTYNKDYAKIYYNKDQAISALVIAKFKWDTIDITFQNSNDLQLNENI